MNFSLDRRIIGGIFAIIVSAGLYFYISYLNDTITDLREKNIEKSIEVKNLTSINSDYEITIKKINEDLLKIKSEYSSKYSMVNLLLEKERIKSNNYINELEQLKLDNKNGCNYSKEILLNSMKRDEE